MIAWLPGAAHLPRAVCRPRQARGARRRRAAVLVGDPQRRDLAGDRAGAGSRSPVQPRAPAGRRPRDHGVARPGVAVQAPARLEGAATPGPDVVLPLSLVAAGSLALLPSIRVRHRREGSRHLRERGHSDRSARHPALRRSRRSSVPPFARDLFFPSHAAARLLRPALHGVPHHGPRHGPVVGQFPHLFPVSIAIGYGIDGLTGAREPSGVWAILGALAVYFAGARLLGHSGRGPAAILLALNVIEVWFARYPNAEVVMQALLFAALLAFARSHVDGDEFFAPVAGSLLGLLLFLRFDAVLGVGAACWRALALMVSRRRRAPSGPGAVLCRAARIAAVAAVSARTDASLRGSADRLSRQLAWWQYLLLAGRRRCASASLLAGARPRRLGAMVRRAHRRSLIVALVGAAIYALYLRVPSRRPRRARCIRASDVHDVLPDAARAPRRDGRVRDVRASHVLAGPGALHRRSRCSLSSSSTRSGSCRITSGWRDGSCR